MSNLTAGPTVGWSNIPAGPGGFSFVGLYDGDVTASGDYIVSASAPTILVINSITPFSVDFEVFYEIYDNAGVLQLTSANLTPGTYGLPSVAPAWFFSVVATGIDAGNVSGTITSVVGGNGQGGDGGDGGNATANGTNSRANGGDGGDAGLASASGGAAGSGAATGGGSSSSNGTAGNNT